MTDRPAVVDLRESEAREGDAGPGPRIAVITAGFPPPSHSAVLDELHALRRAGRLVAVFPTRVGGAGRRSASGPDGVDVGELAGYLRALPNGDARQQAAALAAEVQAIRATGDRVDGLHGWSAQSPAEVAERAGDLLGLPFSFGVHGPDAHRVPAAELERRAGRAVGVVACTPTPGSVLAAPFARVVEVPHGVDLRRFGPTDPERRTDPERPTDPERADPRPDDRPPDDRPPDTRPPDTRPPDATSADAWSTRRAGTDSRPVVLDRPLQVLAVGRMLNRKGFDVLVEAMTRVRHPWRLRIVGDGPRRADLEDQVRRSGAASRVVLTGPVPHHRLPAHYGWADVVVVPSLVDPTGDRDGLPNSVLEAMACAVPVIGTDIGAIGTVLRAAGGGLVVPPGDVRAVATLLDSLAGNAAVRAALGSRGRRYVEREHDLRRCTGRFVTHLEALHRGRVGSSH